RRTRSPSILFATRRGIPPPTGPRTSGAAISFPLRKMPRYWPPALAWLDHSSRRRAPSGGSGSPNVASPPTPARPPEDPAAPGWKALRSRRAAADANPYPAPAYGNSIGIVCSASARRAIGRRTRYSGFRTTIGAGGFEHASARQTHASVAALETRHGGGL